MVDAMGVTRQRATSGHDELSNSETGDVAAPYRFLFILVIVFIELC